MTQSWAILRYVGRKYGYYPKDDPMIAYQIDSTIDAVEDYVGAYFKFNFEPNEEKKAIFRENWIKMLPMWIAAFEKRIEANGGKYIAGTKITIADFAFGSVAFNLLFNEANPHFTEVLPFVKDSQILKKYLNGLREDLKDRLSTRPSPRPF